MEPRIQSYTDLIPHFLGQLKTLGKSQATIAAYRRDLNKFFKFCAERQLADSQIEPSTLIHFKLHLIEESQGKINSARRALISTRQFFRFYFSEEMALPSPFDDIILPGHGHVIPKNLSDMDFETFIAVCKNETVAIKGLRDKALLYLLGIEGLKVSEVIQLEWQDYIDNPEGVSVLRIDGRRRRIIYLSPDAARALRGYYKEWCRLQQNTSDFPPHARMFLGFHGKMLKILPRVSRHGIKFAIYELGHIAHIPHLNTETLRHYAIKTQIALSKSTDDIMRHLGLRRLGNIAKHLKKATDESIVPPHMGTLPAEQTL